MYKRQIDDIEKIKQIEIYGSSKKGAYYSLSSFLEADKPYNGLYINKKVMLENVFETITVDGKSYNLQNLTTISDKYSAKEYICEIDLDKMQYMYRCQNVTIVKKIEFVKGTNILKIDYEINNENEQRSKVVISPLVTYRDQVHMKKASYLKFGNREIDSGILVNLSIVENRNLLLICTGAKYIKVDGYVSNVKHEVTNLELKKDVYIEDLYLPGKFEIQLMPNEQKTVSMYVSDEIIDLEKIENLSMNSATDENESKEKEIDGEYVELKKLVNSLKFFDDTNAISLPSNLYLNMGAVDEKNFLLYLNELLLDIKSIDGRYICIDELNKAVSKIETYVNLLSNTDEYIKKSDVYLKCSLWLIEAMYKLYLKDSESINEEFKEFICTLVLTTQNLVDSKSNNLKNLEVVSLAYNALAIYSDIFKDPRYESLAMDLSDKITNEFWDEQRRVLKKNSDDMEVEASVDMIYAVSLSFSPAKKEIRIKLLDTIFRELYTPLGLRTAAKSNKSSNSLVYPKYMAHFISANLNQNGNSYASKKIAYNLVKDLLLDIDKYVKDNVKYVYSEKGIDIDFKALDLYTTCEMIRLYSMFM